jgi:nucleoside-diphosphate-sugar epimerase
MSKLLLITGINGWIGSAVASKALSLGYSVQGTARHSVATQTITTGNIGPHTDWSRALYGCDTVLHLAARVHVMHDFDSDSLATFRMVNTVGTLKLARQAAAVGIKRFIFVSSVKVHGEHTEPGHAFHANDACVPYDAYAISKHEAEIGLRELSATTGMEVVIVRPPLVYGPGVKANFAAIMQAVRRGWPLPFAAVTWNSRSLLGLDNLVDLLITCIDHPAAANQTFLVSDGEDLSTAELLRRLGQAMGKDARLVYVPTGLLKLGARLANKQDVFQRLCGSLQIDIGKTRQLLDWQPSISVDEGLRRTVQELLR